jgi:hypothetical protein
LLGSLYIATQRDGHFLHTPIRCEIWANYVPIKLDMLGIETQVLQVELFYLMLLINFKLFRIKQKV